MNQDTIFIIIGIIIGIILGIIVAIIERELKKKKLEWIITFTIIGISIIICVSIILLSELISKIFTQSLGYGILFTIVSFIAVRQIVIFTNLLRTRSKNDNGKPNN
jgi:ABC-type lipoprotein release transport system permease subunit